MFPQICGTEPTFRQLKQNVCTPASFTVFNSISDFEIVHFFCYRDLNVAIGTTLYSGWYYRGLNVAVGPMLGQRLKV